MTSATRNAHLAMADSRAMEEQMERTNPVNPKNRLDNRRETVLRNVGAGATPSMGLSQFRGGMKSAMVHPEEQVKYLGYKKSYESKGCEKAGGKFPTYAKWSKMSQHAKQEFCDQWGLHYTGGNHEAHCESDSDNEASDMGHALGRHLHGIHGGAFHKSFAKGFMKGSGQNERDAAQALLSMSSGTAQRPSTDPTPQFRVKDALMTTTAHPTGYTRPDGTVALMAHQPSRIVRASSGRGGRRYDLDEKPQMPRSGLSVAEMRQQHNANTRADYKKSNPVSSAIGEYGMKGVRGLADLAVKHGAEYGVPEPLIEGIKKSRALAEGKGKTGPYEGKGKKRRAPAGASDGRRKRAEVVKRVMAEKGLKMIEASKYVKQHGLY